MVVLLLALCSSGYLACFYAGRVIVAKVRLAHAVDAAAYSVAQMQARTLNAHSYLNRAQLGHHIAMAHLATLGSGIRFQATQARQASRRNPPSTLIGSLFGVSYAIAYSTTARAVGSIEPNLAFIYDDYRAHDVAIHEVIMKTRQSLVEKYQQDRHILLEQTLLKYMEINKFISEFQTLKNMELKYEILVDDFLGKVEVLPSNDSDWTKLITRVKRQYPYLANRNSSETNWWLPLVKCPTYRPKLRRRGYTIQDANGSWIVEDTLSFHAVRSNRTIGCYEREYPMGWAGVSSPGTGLSNAGETRAPTDFSNQSYWRWYQEYAKPEFNPFRSTKNVLASAWARQQLLTWSNLGLANFSRIKKIEKNNIRFKLRVRIKGPSVFGYTVNLSAQSVAETFFDLPIIADSQVHVEPHLNHAFWHSRLTH